MQQLEDGRVIEDAWGVLSKSGTVTSVHFMRGIAETKTALNGGTVIPVKVLYRLPQSFKVQETVDPYVEEIRQSFGGDSNKE